LKEDVGGGVVKTYPTRRLSSQEAFDAWHVPKKTGDQGTLPPPCTSFYSSELGGIVTDAAMMGMHADESLIHSGHGVFDTVVVVKGCAYQLEERIERLLMSAVKANVRMPDNWTRQQLKQIVLETVAAGKLSEGG